MTPRKKTLITISMTLICLIVIQYVISRTVLLTGFAKLEAQNARQNAERATSVLFDEILNLDTMVSDWAAWDDTYTFIEDANDEYIQSNLVDETFISPRINFMLFINVAGQTVFGKGFDLQSQEQVPTPSGLQEHLADDALLLRHHDPESNISGIILIPEGPTLIASRPILTSEEEGPIRGTLIMGRFLDSAAVERLAQTTHLLLTLHLFNDPQMPPDLRSSLSEEKPILARPLGADFVAGYALLKDIYGQPGLILRVDLPREIYKQGQTSMLYFILSLLVIGLVFGGVVLWFSERTERKRTEHELSQRLQEQETLFAIGQLVSSSLQIDEVLQLVAEQMARLVDAASCAIYDWDPEAGVLAIQAKYVRPDQVYADDSINDLWQDYSVCDCPTTAKALQDGKPFVVYSDDPEADSQERHLLQLYQWYGVAGIPLVVQHRVIGLAKVYMAEEGQSFDAHDLRLLQSLANQVAAAIDNARLFSVAQANEAAMRDLSLRLINVQEQERRAIAQELHDELGQLLTAAKINIDLVRRKLSQQAEREGPDPATPLRSRLEDASALTDKVLTNVRALTVELRPVLLDDMGIVPTLRWYLGRFATRTGIQVQLDAPELPARLLPEIETTIYRAVVEALTNVARHAQANQVQVQLTYSGDMVTASIEDDGQGFDLGAWSKHLREQQTLGLTGIQERAMLLDGYARITSQPGQGTRVEIKLPARFRLENE
jgi:sensor domain CHASE-containing protein/signal transduction histidine kinase